MKLPHHHPYTLSDPWTAGVVILGAGQGERLGHGPKALIELGGRPLLLHVLEAMSANRSVTAIAVTAPDGLTEEFEQLIDSAQPQVPVRVIPGGPTRQASAYAGVAALPPGPEWVAVTDVARPFTEPGTVDRLLDSLRATAQSPGPAPHPCGVVPVLPLVDSVHLAAEEPLLAEPFDRSILRAAQTPQVFHRDCVSTAYEEAQREGTTHTDDAGMVSRLGGTVVTAPGTASNFKITFEHDLMLAQAVHAHAQTVLPGRGSAI